MNNPVVLLTGTIDPQNMIFTKITDKDFRKNQYIDSIKFWLKETKCKIIFVENSNNDISPYFEDALNSFRLEILCFNGNTYSREVGKGYGELLCIEYALKNSKILKTSNFVFKITGRHKVLNFLPFFERYDKNKDLDLLLDFNKNLTFCDSRIFGFTPVFFYDYLYKYKNSLNDTNGVYFEHILAKASLIAISQGLKYLPFPSSPKIKGISGSNNIKYDLNNFEFFKNSIKFKLKSYLIEQ
ncbi:hypothetical protein [Pontibacter harenae]|uniref:hypothetical protein n=1 Tax=Pontibacter harenae TaxID=2894083 RepID=UPI001E4B24D1|nr:hypothetical protein [Pontibacter harenae]MCC9166152.1 hypothetical protein [Pontibacter harenae]